MSTPFVEAAQAYPGLQPSGVRQSVETAFSKKLWIGRPEVGEGLVELPSPRYSTAPSVSQSRGESPHTLINGGTATHILPSKARSWTFAWPRLTRAQFDLLDALQSREPGLFGNGPWAMLNPEGRNRLTRAQSMCRDTTAWSPTGAGTVAAVAGLGAVSPSGVLKWTPDATGALLVAGSSTSAPDVSRVAPYVPAEPFTFTFRAKAVSGSAQVSARVVGCDAAGVAAATQTGSAVTVTAAAWSSVTVSAAAGAFGSALYLCPELVSGDGAAVLISNPMTSYTASVVDWGPGGGVPRVVLTTGVPREIAVTLESDGVALTFAEHVVGVA